MSARQSRIQRKAARVQLTETEREFNRELGVLRRVRDEANRKANLDFEKDLARLRDMRNEARKAADEEYEEGRAKLLQRLAAKEAA